jgi:tRNA pseudouridine13 synthase
VETGASARALQPVSLARERPEDFVVEEIPLYLPSGEGGHTFVQVEKRLRTTEQVARELARRAGVPARDVGYAGRKDRVGVTRQWFSVPGLAPAEALALELVGARVLDASRHPHKLRTGQLRGNRFGVRVRGAATLAAAVRARLAELQGRGFPNRFGPQRFGRGGDNALRARRLLRGGSSGDRREARFLLSALQAEVFNEVLRARPLPLDRVEAGDVAVVHASGGLFVVEEAERENARAAAFEISATGPIFGLRVREPLGAPAQREAEATARLGVPEPSTLRLPRGVRLRGARRALRARPADAECAVEGADLLLRFSLPPGAFASVLLEELFGAVAKSSDDTPPPQAVC